MLSLAARTLLAQEPSADTGYVSWMDILLKAGWVGWVIIALSIAAVALVVEHLVTIRRTVVMPPWLVRQADVLMSGGQLAQLRELCASQRSLLGRMLGAGLNEADQGYGAVDKAMEEACQEQAARLYRKIEYLSLIGNLAPMLGLLGTVLGMIEAFRVVAHVQGADKAPQLASGIYLALVTTLEGLVVAIPCLGAFSIFRNRVDQLTAESALVAEELMIPLKRRVPPDGAAPVAARAAPRGKPGGSG